MELRGRFLSRTISESVSSDRGATILRHAFNPSNEGGCAATGREPSLAGIPRRDLTANGAVNRLVEPDSVVQAPQGSARQNCVGGDCRSGQTRRGGYCNGFAWIAWSEPELLPAHRGKRHCER